MPKYKMGREISNQGSDSKKGTAGGKKKLGGRKISNLLGIVDPNRDKIKGGKNKELKNALKEFGSYVKNPSKKAPRARGGR